VLLAGLFVALAGAIPGGSPDAQAQGQKALRANSSAGDKYYERGREHARKGEDDQALDDFKRAIELDPNRFESYKALDDILSRRGQWDTIIAYWTRFIELQPSHAQAYCERGGAYYGKRDIANALRDAEKACRLGNQFCCQVVANYNRHAAAAAQTTRGFPRWDVAALLSILAVVGAGIAFLIGVPVMLYRSAKKRPVPEGPAGGVEESQLSPELKGPPPRPVLPIVLALGLLVSAACLFLFGSAADRGPAFSVGALALSLLARAFGLPAQRRTVTGQQSMPEPASSGRAEIKTRLAGFGVICLLGGAVLVFSIMPLPGAGASWSAVWRSLSPGYRVVVMAGYAVSAWGLSAIVVARLARWPRRPIP